MVSETGLGVLQVVNAVAQGLVKQKKKSGLIESILGSANHDASEEELNGIKTAMQRNYSKEDLTAFSQYITDSRNSLHLSKEKGAGYKIPDSPWFISTQQASTAGLDESDLRMSVYSDSLTKANVLAANSNIPMASAIRTVYQGLNYTDQTRWREAAFGTGQEGKIDRVKYDLLRDNFQYISALKGPSGRDPRMDPMQITESGYNALLKITNLEDRQTLESVHGSYPDLIKILKEHPLSPVVTEFYSRLAMASEGAAKSEEERSKAEEGAMRQIQDNEEDEEHNNILDEILAGGFASSNELPNDIPARKSLNSTLRQISENLNVTVDAYGEDRDGNTVTTKDKLRLYAESIVAKDSTVQRELSSQPELRQSYLDYVYSRLQSIYTENRYRESLSYAGQTALEGVVEDTPSIAGPGLSFSAGK
tara:strand:+ start:2289 stop:3554 length:1266 start_codon:yes stop_codon:yes gene_type:complete